METYSIELRDGTLIENLTLNGNNYMSDVDVGEKNFTRSNLSKIKINGMEYINMTLKNYWHDNDGWHIVIAELTKQELFEESINAKLDYIAMMEDIKL